MKETIYSVSIFSMASGEVVTIGTFTNKFEAQALLEKKFHELCDQYGVEELNVYSYQDKNSFRLDNTHNGGKMYVCGSVNTTTLQSNYYAVSYVSREDLDIEGYDVESLSDNDLERIADKMGDYYGDNSYLYDLESAANFIGLKKRY